MLSRASNFNDTVAMVLHQLGGNLWHFHFIVKFSCFSSAIIVKTKSSKIITEKFLQNWISVSGPPSKIFSDNGGKFASQDFIDLCENFNINIITTLAESPSLNSVCEWHNKILTKIVLKINKAIKCTWETALAWAVNGKNCLMNINGFSPHQLVFGQNVKLPNIFHDQISAGIPDTKTVGEHISALHAARKAFINAETSDKLHCALRKQVWKPRQYYKMNGIVYYSWNIDDKWKGTGQDGPVVFLQHGGFLIKGNCNRIQAKNLHDETSSIRDSNNKKSTIQSKKDESIDNKEFTVTKNPIVNPQPPSAAMKIKQG